MSVRKGNDVLAGSTPLKIDNALNEASVNPVQNKVVADAIDNINTTLATKQDTLSAGDSITITNNTVAVGDLDCGTMS